MMEGNKERRRRRRGKGMDTIDNKGEKKGGGEERGRRIGEKKEERRGRVSGGLGHGGPGVMSAY